MNQSPPPNHDANPAAAQPHATSRRWAWVVAGVAVMVAVAVSGRAIWYGMAQSASAPVSVEARLSRIEQQALATDIKYTTLREQVSTLHERLGHHDRDWQRRLATLDNAISAQQEVLDARLVATEQKLVNDRVEHRQQLDALTDSLAEVHAQLGRGLTDWGLAEVEQLLTIANHRLLFSSEPALAQAALQLAQQRLATLPLPQLLPAREAVAVAVATLAARPPLDTLGLLSQLHALAAAIKYLPLQSDARIVTTPKGDVAPTTVPATPAAPNTAQPPRTFADYFQPLLTAVTRLFTRLDDMIQVEKNATSVKPLISAEVRLLYYEKVRLLLDAAQLALLRQEAAVFQDRIAVTRAWFLQYFAQDSTPAQTWLEQLATVGETAAVAMPGPAEIDLSGALQALRAVIEKQQQSLK